MAQPRDPVLPPGIDLTELAASAAATTEMFNAYVKAGMPPMAVAVMIGTWLATAGSHGQPGDDGR